ncbi:MAG: hypothetical protein ACYTF6_04700 [Planctomycetota bacterium]|jgi:1,4-dihydroxy-2-naphthoate octaprenyltransferase
MTAIVADVMVGADVVLVVSLFWGLAMALGGVACVCPFFSKTTTAAVVFGAVSVASALSAISAFAIMNANRLRDIPTVISWRPETVLILSIPAGVGALGIVFGLRRRKAVSL